MILTLRKLIVKIRMAYADVRGHHGKKWNYEPGDYYMGRNKIRKIYLKKTLILRVVLSIS